MMKDKIRLVEKTESVTQNIQKLKCSFLFLLTLISLFFALFLYHVYIFGDTAQVLVRFSTDHILLEFMVSGDFESLKFRYEKSPLDILN